MTPETRAALDGAMELARREGFQIWGFANRATEVEDEVEFFSFDNWNMSDRDFCRMVNLAMKLVRKYRTQREAEPELRPEESN